MTRSAALRSLLLLTVGLISCDASPRELVVGEDACRYCRMTIDDARFGGLVITSRGRVETFDSIECLAAFVASLPGTERPRAVWVADFAMPSRWVDVASAQFLHQADLRSPMGRDLAAFAATDRVPHQRYGGHILSWPDVLALVARERFAPAGAPVGESARTPSAPPARR